MRSRLLALSLLFISFRSAAEYRAFELVISDATSGRERVVISTLDPNQYRGYYPISPQEKVAYRTTWMCRGNTSDFRTICPNPKGK
jgi:hypothetical protein